MENHLRVLSAGPGYKSLVVDSEGKIIPNVRGFRVELAGYDGMATVSLDISLPVVEVVGIAGKNKYISPITKIDVLEFLDNRIATSVTTKSAYEDAKKAIFGDVDYR